MDEGIDSDDLDDLNGQYNDEILSREEVYFTGKENIEGLACLLNIFLNPLIHSSQHPAVLNIDNHEDFDENKIKRG